MKSSLKQSGDKARGKEKLVEDDAIFEALKKITQPLQWGDIWSWSCPF
jgi:hypothetical protein